jgi:hypothetical protein
MKIILALLLLLFILPVHAQTYSLSSPDKLNKIEVTSGKNISFRVLDNGKELMSPTTISIEIDKVKPGDLQTISRLPVLPNHKIM